MALAVFLVETPSDCCVLCPNLCSLLAVLPCSLPSQRYPRTLHLCVRCVTLCSSLFCLFVVFCFSLYSYYFCSYISAVLAPPAAGHSNAGLVFLAPFLFISPLFFSLSCLPSFCWSITWTYHRTDRTSKQQPCSLWTRPPP